MPEPIVWTAATDYKIKELRGEGRSWDHIALVVGRARWTVIIRGREIGAKAPVRTEATPDSSDDRRPLAAGSAITWDSINVGTGLEGVPYPTITAMRDGTLVRSATV